MRARWVLPTVVLCGVAAPAGGWAGPTKVDFSHQVLPIFMRACGKCHGGEKHSAGLRLTSGLAALAGGVTGKLVVPGKSGDSYLVARLLGQGDEDRMPVEADALPPGEIDLIRRWIDEGAQVPEAQLGRFEPAPVGLRRLTVAQYENAIMDLLGEKVASVLEPDDRSSVQFSTMAAYRVSTSDRGVEQYREAGLRVARAAFANQGKREELLGCALRSVAEPCVAKFLARFGARAWRRALSAAELATYLRLAARTGVVRKSPWRGVEAAVAGLLISPNFIYVPEVGESDPTHPGRLRFSSYEMATRLALFFWNSIPDVELMNAAQDGRLLTVEGIRAEARRLLASPKARPSARRFFAEHLGLDDLRTLSKDEKVYPQATGTLPAAMREEIERLTEYLVFDRKGDILDLFDTRETFVNGELQRLYGLPDEPAAPELPGGDDFHRVSLPADGPRAGLLGTAGILALYSNATRSSPTLRGVFIRERLLCQEVPPPPPGVSTELAPPKDKKAPPRTLREQLGEHASNPVCANCHSFFDPLGLSMEHFDGIGAWRANDNGHTLDVSGVIDGAKYAGALELGALIKRNPRAPTCLARELYSYAAGHAIGPGEEGVVAAVSQAFDKSGHDFQDLMIAIAVSDGFRFATPPPPVVARR
jgi:hypothetical protein